MEQATVKVSYSGKTRRFRMPYDITWQKMSAQLRTLYGIEDAVPISLSYEDLDGDSVCLSSELELQDVLSIAKDNGKSLKFDLLVNEEDDSFSLISKDNIQRKLEIETTEPMNSSSFAAQLVHEVTSPEFESAQPKSEEPLIQPVILENYDSLYASRAFVQPMIPEKSLSETAEVSLSYSDDEQPLEQQHEEFQLHKGLLLFGGPLMDTGNSEELPPKTSTPVVTEQVVKEEKKEEEVVGSKVVVLEPELVVIERNTPVEELKETLEEQEVIVEEVKQDKGKQPEVLYNTESSSTDTGNLRQQMHELVDMFADIMEANPEFVAKACKVRDEALSDNVDMDMAKKLIKGVGELIIAAKTKKTCKHKKEKHTNPVQNHTPQPEIMRMPSPIIPDTGSSFIPQTVPVVHEQLEEESKTHIPFAEIFAQKPAKSLETPNLSSPTVVRNPQIFFEEGNSNSQNTSRPPRNQERKDSTERPPQQDDINRVSITMDELSEIQAQENSLRDLEEKILPSIICLQEMGFVDVELNERLLRHFNGNLEAVVDCLSSRAYEY